MNAAFYKNQLQLISHPEGGFYREMYRNPISQEFSDFSDKRNIATSIYFLLENENKSHFHRIKSDEIWCFHEGTSLEIVYFLDNQLKTINLGKNISEGEVLQAYVPANTWFSSRVKNYSGFSLVSCIVAPGFDFVDFEMAKKTALQHQFPDFKEIINEMCLD
ncbi:MAG: cupin domain-containing protein [Bacteroidetes bacterium]|nr:MAG: cupin domain-containing protein [Bacteroidota bacterium]